MADLHRRSRRPGQAPGIGLAVLAALLFGASTPGAHWLLGQFPPVLLSALLYLGSGIGLTAVWGFERLHGPAAAAPPTPAVQANWPLAAAIACGGVIAPVALLLGMQSTPASSAALLLNLEGVFTAVLAWWAFGEGVDRGVALGMLSVVLGGLLLAWPDQGGPGSWTPASLRGPALIGLACLAWALDNNLTRSAAHLDARLIARWKGLVAGTCNLVLAGVAAGSAGALHDQLLAGRHALLPALLTGWLGYGISLVAYVRAQALLGAARTGAWFGLAPFAGVTIALLVLHEPAPPLLWPAAALIALGLWLHVRERHAHWHQHQALAHGHAHVHDAHHQHDHAFAWDGVEPHVHPHAHPDLLHRHVHFPDLHHRHRHAHAPQPADLTEAGSTLAPALIRAYRQATTYRVLAESPAGAALDLRVGQPCDALQALLTGLQGGVFITACNPLGARLDTAANAALQTRLADQMHDAGLRVLAGMGQGEDPDWPGEASLLVLDVGRADAILLGRHWQQNAVVWAGPDGVPHLLLLR